PDRAVQHAPARDSRRPRRCPGGRRHLWGDCVLRDAPDAGTGRADGARRQALWPVGLGIAAGLLASLGTTRLLTNQLFGVTPVDPITFGVVAVVLAFVALAASVVPALRAAAADPTSALRS